VARSRFDPNRARGAEPAPTTESLFAAKAGAKPLSVSQASELIKSTLEQTLPTSLNVAGEVSNLSVKGHWYFSLKDESAVLSCVAWATAVKKFSFTPKDGDAVVATGHVSHYAPQGRTQLYVTALQPAGAGPLERRYRELCEQLRGLGYFEESRKKPLPLLPRRIAVITSATGAAVHDVITTAAHRCKAVGLLLIDVKVQGDGAAEEIVKAIKWVDSNHRKLGVDAMLVTRGGGSIEDLWTFNERIVADAVHRCTVPVVAAIGHESDTTIIELVADVRASTPTQAAMRLVPAAKELGRQIDHVQQRLRMHLQQRLGEQGQSIDRNQAALLAVLRLRLAHERLRLQKFAGRLGESRPQAVLQRRRDMLVDHTRRLYAAMQRRADGLPSLDRLHRRLRMGVSSRIQREVHRISAHQRELAAMDPHGVLRRGYSITMKRDGRIIRSAGDVVGHEPITTRLSDGMIESVVGRQADGDQAIRSSSKRPGGSVDQPDLFSLPSSE
jgi:exodeoxyribonuclease VII large subunit